MQQLTDCHLMHLQPAGHDDQAQGVQLVDARGVSSLGVAGPPAVLDPNRAFQAINAETLEAAAQDMHYPVPPQQVPSTGALKYTAGACAICVLAA